MKKALIAIASLVCTLGASTGARQPPAGRAKLNALIITGQHGHDWQGTTPLLTLPVPPSMAK